MKLLGTLFAGALLTFSGNTMASLPNTAESKDITQTLVLAIQSDEAWDLWTRADELERWLTVKANVDPTLGGAYELFWNPETPDQNSTKGCRVTALVRRQLLSFEWKGPVPYADLMNTDPSPTWMVITFEPISDAATILHFRHSGWGEGPRWMAARAWQERAWDMAFREIDRLMKDRAAKR